MEAWTAGKVELAAWQFIPERLTALGLTTDDVMTSVWFVENGRLFAAAEAMNRVMRYAWWAKPVTYLYPLPGMKQIQERVYRWIADNRHRMPGSTAACALPPQKEAAAQED